MRAAALAGLVALLCACGHYGPPERPEADPRPKDGSAAVLAPAPADDPECEEDTEKKQETQP